MPPSPSPRPRASNHHWRSVGAGWCWGGVTWPSVGAGRGFSGFAAFGMGHCSPQSPRPPRRGRCNVTGPRRAVKQRGQLCGSESLLSPCVVDLVVRGSGACMQILKTKGVRDFVSVVQFTPDGERLVVGTADGMVRVWDLSAGTPLFEIDRR